jgi:hypothetical protein
MAQNGSGSPYSCGVDDEVRQELGRLERRLAAIPEPAMRREQLLGWLEPLAPADAFDRLSAVLHAGPGPAPGSALREATLDVIALGGATRVLPYELRASWYAEARRAEDAFVARLLRSSDAAESMADPGAELARDLGELPLGVRRSLARGHELPTLEKLLLDPDAIVVGHLLANPRVTEIHVVRIAARRPIPADTLRAIARSSRFGQRPGVRLAIARNPYAPTDLVVRMLDGLPLRELREIARDGTLHAVTREHAQAELARRDTAVSDAPP